MTIFGHALSITLVLQLVTSAIVLGLYALSESMQEQKAKHQSDRNMIFLVAFLVHHHPTIHTLDEVGGMAPGAAANSNGTWKFFSQSLQRFQEDGALPELDPSAKTTLGDHFGSLLVFTIFALPALIGMLIFREKGTTPIFHTALRKNVVSRTMVIFSANIFIGLLLAGFLTQRHPLLCGILLVVPFIAVLQCVILFARNTKEQQLWKEYWSDRLMEIMAAASRKDDHDLFNRALFLKNDVDSQPDLPIPGKLSLYTTVYSLVQVSILFLSRTLHLS